MQISDSVRPQIIQRRKFKVSTMVLSATGLVSIALALVSSFGLARWAEAAPLHHAVQHILLFLGGLGLGSVGMQLLKRSK